ncbi:protein WEAK CHLOROPLAST MOVEMENT UNDER BLUE LIGHT 1-like [Zingiber officinale]|uniref:protein WEAK CHLOROPLAST MOVEMENT UNDER BLUE LIGHT 1-like n=1 Tax=Zingiber officinale TaxID=94328 RepID=UPI001C4C90EB|nr:protein WEAK CHLOROPLAST MOVEMENT UNDER BLUE LIGHT 1-like [Zingiber officinale]
MAQTNSNGESSCPSIFSSSPDSSSSPSSSPLPAIFKNEDGDQRPKGLQMDDTFFLNDTQVLHDHLIQLEVAKQEESELDGQILLLPNLADNSESKKSLPDPPSFNESKNDGAKKEDDRINRVLVDTAAPFESVRAAVTKFRGIVDCKAEETLSIEVMFNSVLFLFCFLSITKTNILFKNSQKQRQAQLELKKVQEEIVKYQKRFQDEETATGQVLEELDYFKGHAEELNLRLERAETLNEQAKQDSALADLRLREVVQGIANGASLASRAQLDVANERYASAVAELKSVTEELEPKRVAYVSLLRERDVAVEKVADSFAATKEIELTVQELTLKLISTKELLESAHATHLHAADQTIIAALTLDIEKLMWHNLLKHAEEELQQVHEQMLLTNDAKSELCRASTVLLNLKAELVSLDYATMEIEEVRSHIEKSTDSVDSIKIQLSSLQCDLDREMAALRAVRQREDSQSASISSLEAQLYRMNLELELVQKREGAIKKKLTGEKQAKLQELSKAKEEALQAKAEATAMELKLTAALKQIEAAKAWQALANSEVKSLQASREDSNGVILPLEEYSALIEKAKEAEEQAKERITPPIKQMEAAKESESKSLEKLEKAKETLEGKKKELRAAMERLEKAEEERQAEEEKLLMEQELDKPNDEQKQGSFDVGEKSGKFSCEVGGESSTESPRGVMERAISTEPEPRRRKRMFFARIVTFLARKKVQSLK